MQRYFEINENGHNIRSKIYYNDLNDVRRVVLFVHGFGGHKDNGAAEKFAQRLLTKYKGVAMITFDLPCHGNDVKRKLSLSDCDTYITLVIAHIKSRFNTGDIYLYATSFGGYLSLKYIAEHGSPFKKSVLRCPAVNMYDAITNNIMTSSDMEKLKKGKDVPVGFDRKITISSAFLEELKNTDVQQFDYLDYAEDMLIIHGDCDEIVPFDASQTFADNNLINFVAVPKADHRFQNPIIMEQAIKEILAFYEL